MDPRLSSTFRVLHLTYGLVPIVAGLDKFTNLLTDWTGYLSPAVAGALPLSPQAFMYLVGIIEIAAGILTLVKPRVGAWVVGAWLVAIALNLVILGRFDIAVRDIVMAIAAFSLGRLDAIRARVPQRATEAPPLGAHAPARP